MKTCDHPFISAPHTTLFSLSLPLLLSLVAEPLTGLVDTAFISRLGAAPLAAVGIGTTALTGIFWAFNFLGIGTQTEIARALGSRDRERVKQISALALGLSLLIGTVLAGITFPLSSGISTLMGAGREIQELSVSYFKIRLSGAPAILITFAAFGILRGLQDMKTQLKIAVGINIINIILDPVLIFGLGPVPALGVAGAALASAASQWAGAGWAVFTIFTTSGFSKKVRLSDGVKLFKVGRDLFIRTGMLTLFLMLTTRTATLNGPDAGAAHQALRQFWIFTALFLDAYAVAGQSLVGYFTGTGQHAQVLRVARIVCLWSLVIGAVLSLSMILGQSLVERLIVPETAVDIFRPAWMIVCLFQPLNALAFGTDGIHWGTGDFPYLRNAMVLASLFGVTALYLMDVNTAHALTKIWIITGLWVGMRSSFGILRIWPGIGDSPFKN
ncbi:MAG: MATE family efflux transporter [Desulfobacterales bacterium]|nr:MATE family efflux transporter [Desulfobacterales bacterium]